jgi:hypothetical protein
MLKGVSWDIHTEERLSLMLAVAILGGAVYDHGRLPMDHKPEAPDRIINVAAINEE